MVDRSVCSNGTGGTGVGRDRQPFFYGGSERHMASGTVKFFNTSKGFGFIAPDGGGADIFVHISEVQRSGLQGLNEGQKVSFESKMDPKKGKPNAVNIKAS